jgi:hypothetical protein
LKAAREGSLKKRNKKKEKKRKEKIKERNVFTK